MQRAVALGLEQEHERTRAVARVERRHSGALDLDRLADLDSVDELGLDADGGAQHASGQRGAVDLADIEGCGEAGRVVRVRVCEEVVPHVGLAEVEAVNDEARERRPEPLDGRMLGRHCACDSSRYYCGRSRCGGVRVPPEAGAIAAELANTARPMGGGRAGQLELP